MPRCSHVTHTPWEFVIAFAISAAGARWALWYTRRLGLLDLPNHRSSHIVPTPRGGGIALVGAVVLTWLYVGLRGNEIPRLAFLSVLTAIILLATVGWMDDRRSLRVGSRLSVHLLCGIAVAVLLNGVAKMPPVLNFAWLSLWIFWTVASINIVNFMDGLDGMVAS